MKTILRVAGAILLLLLLLAGGGYLYINARGIPTYPVEPVAFELESSPEAVARGKKLAMMLCVNCHRDRETGRLTGAHMADVPTEFGTVYSKNITQDPQYGIGDWTDGELVHLFRTGIGRDGRYLPPYMPKWPHLADADLNAIIAFLRSDDPLVQADPTPDRECEPSFLTKMLCTVAFKPLPLPSGPIALPDTLDELALGKYLAINLDCYSCHSADFSTANALEPEKSAGYFGGGNQPLDYEGRVVVTSNLTPHETGIGTMSPEAFVNAVRLGIKPGGGPALRYPMMPYNWLTEHEARAIYAYLQTVPPIDNPIERVIYE